MEATVARGWPRWLAGGASAHYPVAQPRGPDLNNGRMRLSDRSSRLRARSRLTSIVPNTSASLRGFPEPCRYAGPLSMAPTLVARSAARAPSQIHHIRASSRGSADCRTRSRRVGPGPSHCAPQAREVRIRILLNRKRSRCGRPLRVSLAHQPLPSGEAHRPLGRWAPVRSPAAASLASTAAALS